MELWLSLLGVVGGGAAGFVTSWWQARRSRNDSRSLAIEALSNAAAQRIIEILASLDKALDEYDHAIFMEGHVALTPKEYQKQVLAVARDNVEAVWRELDRSVLVDGPLLSDRLLADQLLDLWCKIPNMFTPFMDDDGRVYYGGWEGEKPNLAMLAVDALRDGLAANIAQRSFDSKRITSALQDM